MTSLTVGNRLIMFVAFAVAAAGLVAVVAWLLFGMGSTTTKELSAAESLAPGL